MRLLSGRSTGITLETLEASVHVQWSIILVVFRLVANSTCGPAGVDGLTRTLTPTSSDPSTRGSGGFWMG